MTPLKLPFTLSPLPSFTLSLSKGLRRTRHGGPALTAVTA